MRPARLARKAALAARTRPVIAAIAAGLLTFGGPGSARANGRYPAANQIVSAPSDHAYVVLRTTFGVVLSHDGGETWDWVCENAIGFGGSIDPPLGMMGGALIAGTFEGVATSTDDGCGWKHVFGDKVIDVVVRPNVPTQALALTSKYAGQTDAGDTAFDSKIYATSDDGAHFAVLGPPLDPALVPETVELAASDPHRIYVSGVKQSGVLLVSKDDGAHWTEHAIPLESGERSPFVSAVDPKNADRIYVRVKGVDSSRLVVSDDGGVTFRSVLTGKDFRGFALSEDGKTVYIGGPDDGLLAASSTDFRFEKRANVDVQCLATVGATLFACAGRASDFIVGASSDGGATFAPKLRLDCVRGPLACAAASSAAACLAEWPQQRATLGGSGLCSAPRGDAGTTTGPSPTSDAGSTPAGAGSSDGGGCMMQTSPATGGAATLGLAAALAGLALRRRDTRRARRAR